MERVRESSPKRFFFPNRKADDAQRRADLPSHPPPPNRAHFPPTSYDTALPPPNPLVQYSMMG